MGILVCMLGTVAIVLVSGCTSSTSAPAIDPIAGSWTYASTHNNTTVTAVLVFAPDGNFNGYIAGLLTLNGHWTKANDTAYNVYWGNKTQVFFINGGKTQISESTAPQVIFTKQ